MTFEPEAEAVAKPLRPPPEAAPVITPLTVFAVAVLGYSLVSRRLASSVVTMPIFFVAVGFLAGPVAGLLHVDPGDERLVLLLEAALVMVLFADSSALDVHRWTREPALSGRLLGIGLPLTMLAGALVALVVFPGSSHGRPA